MVHRRKARRFALLRDKKKPDSAIESGFFVTAANFQRLLDLGFLVHDVLADFRIELLDLHLAGHGALVFGGGVEMACSGTGHQLDLVSHIALLDLFAASAKLGKYGIDATLVDDSHALRGQSQADKTLFRSHPEAVRMQIRQEATARAIFCMRHVVTTHWTFAGDLAHSGHGDSTDKND